MLEDSDKYRLSHPNHMYSAKAPNFPARCGSDASRLSKGSFIAILLAACVWMPSSIPAAVVSPPVRSTFYNGSARVTFPHRAEYDATTNVTIEAWIYRSASDSFDTILSHNWVQSFWFGVANNNRLRFYRSGGLGAFKDSTNAVPSQRWTHVAAAYDGSRIRFYIDGQVAGDEALGNAGINRAQSLVLGDDLNGGLGLNGHLDEVRLWASTRSAAQIQGSRFSEISAETGLVARFPAGGRTNSVAGVLGTVTGIAESGWGVLPRNLVAPRSASPVNFNFDLSEFVANNADRIIWRYLDGLGAQRDVEGYIMYRDEIGDRNLYVAVPNNSLREDELSALQPLWFSVLVDTNASGEAAPQIGDFRFDSRVNNLGASATNILRQGDGTNWVTVPGGAPGWSVNGFEACEFDCGRIFKLPAGLLGGFLQPKRVLFGEFAYGAGPFFFPYSLPSPMDASVSSPATWPLLVFGGTVGSLPRAMVEGRVVNVTAGADAALAGISVTLFNLNTGTVFDSGFTDGSGNFSLDALVYPTNTPLRVACGLPGTGIWRRLPPLVSGNQVAVTTADEFNGVTYAAAVPGTSNYLGAVTFPVIRWSAPTLSSVSPSTGHPRLILRDSPRKSTDATQITVTGSNLHSFCTFTLSHQNGDAPINPGDELPTGPGVTNFPLRVVSRSADWTSVTLELDFDLLMRPSVPSDSWLAGPYRILLRDNWVSGWVQRAGLTIQPPDFPLAHGFEFRNEGDDPTFDEFSSVFGNNSMMCAGVQVPGTDTCLGCRVPDPFAWLFYPVFAPIVAGGSCNGMSATSLLLARRQLVPETVQAGVHFGNGFIGLPPAVGDSRIRAPRPGAWNFNFCNPFTPQNIWSHIRRNHGVQLSTEFIEHCLSQLTTAVGLVNLPASPRASMERIRATPVNYVVVMNNGFGAVGHVVTPFRVIDGFGCTDGTTLVPDAGLSVIHVYDNNFPGATRFIQVNSAADRYFYHAGFRNGDGAQPIIYRERGMFTIPWDMFTRPLHVPTTTAALHLFTFADCDVRYTDGVGGEFGWDAAGNLATNYEGAGIVMPLSLNPGDPTRHAIFCAPSNRAPVNVQVNVRGSVWGWHGGQAGNAFQIISSNATAGDIDRLSLAQHEGKLNNFAYKPQRTQSNFLARLGMAFGERESAVFEWQGLRLPAGGQAGFGADRDRHGVSFANNTGTGLTYVLRVHAADGPSSTSNTNDFGPFNIPAGAKQSVALTGWPSPTLRNEMDLNGDGSPDIITFISPATGTNASAPVITARMLGGAFVVSWTLSSAQWQLEQTLDVGGSSVVWGPVLQQPTESGGVVSVILPTLEPKLFLRLRSLD